MNIKTLGPTGTNCEHAAKYYLQSNKINGSIELYNTLEDALKDVMKDIDSVLLSCIVYPQLHELVFDNLSNIELVDSFIYNTFPMVFASKNKVKPKTIATHPAPQSLIKGMMDIEIVNVNSNSLAAIECFENRVESCITTLPCARKYRLKILQNFGEVPMGFAIHRRKINL